MIIRAEEHDAAERQEPRMVSHTIRVLAKIHSDFQEKFGIPRQSGLVPDLQASIVFEPEFRNPDALRGIEGFSHVRPPRLGGNTRVGVFATRSPFRPNALGLSCVRLERMVSNSPQGPMLIVSGADLLDGTPIYDIKPYIPYADCLPQAVGGFAAERPAPTLRVDIPDSLLQRVPPEKRDALLRLLELDPRPSYHSDPERIYGMRFADCEIRFAVQDLVLTVKEIRRE